MAFAITSSAFANGQALPSKYTCDGMNVSPPLAWTDVPAGTESLLLSCSDPDAPGGTFGHWVAYNIPPDQSELREGGLAGGADTRVAQAVNDFGNAEYGGPCPPRGDRPHAYRFRLVALSGPIDVPTPEPTCAEIVEASVPLEIASTEIVGYYGR
ncbi:MAG: YbhB/YbcL family Raf kinase inhibitor-like protein [Hyphomicrobiaceae bacterium]|nr:YbhB/YbcL family Raf kinase inhibitor-like protein [Hyphomicrobiaceae bacterium]